MYQNGEKVITSHEPREALGPQPSLALALFKSRLVGGPRNPCAIIAGSISLWQSSLFSVYRVQRGRFPIVVIVFTPGGSMLFFAHSGMSQHKGSIRADLPVPAVASAVRMEYIASGADEDSGRVRASIEVGSQCVWA